MNRFLSKYVLISSIFFVYSFCGFSQVLLTSTGVSNAFSVNYPANITTIQSGLSLVFFSNQTITGPATLNVNATGAKSILKNVNQALSTGEIKAGQAVSVIYDGTNWQLTSNVSPSSTTGFWSTLGNTSDSTFNYIGTNNNQPLAFYTNGTERMRISRAGRFGFNMNPTASSMFNIKSIGNGAILTVNRSTDSGSLIELTETGGGNARIDMYTSSNSNVVQIPSGPGNIFFAGGGNLGVNTTAPGNTFHVLGGARISSLTTSGPVFSNVLGDLYVSTAVSNFWTISGINLQPLSNLYGVNLTTTFGGYSVNGNKLIYTNGSNVAFLGNSGSASNNGNNNLFFGTSAGSSNIGGYSNIFLGSLAGSSNISGIENIFIGESAGQNATGNNNLFLGQNAGRNTTSAFNNIFLGQSAGQTNISGGGNIIIGPLADVSTSGLSNAIAIGLYATVGGSNTMVLGGTGPNSVKVGIGTGLPQNTLHVVGGARINNLTSTGNYFVQANSLGDLFISTNTGQSAFWALGGNSVPGIRTIGTTNNFDLPIIANNVEWMRVRSNGNIGIGNTIPGARLDITAAGSTTGTAFRILDSNGAISFNVLDNGASGIGTSAISGYQLYLQTATADPNYRSLVISNDYSGASNKYGIYNSVTGNGSGTKYCTYNILTGLAGDNSPVYGEYTNMDPQGTGTAYGNLVNVGINGTGVRYGFYAQVYGAVSNPSPIYGVLGYVNHTGTAAGAASYSFYGQNSSSGLGNQYGIYTISEQYNYHSGSLGLGISVPTERLDVSGNVEVTGEYKYSSPRTRYKSLSGATFSVESNAYYLNQAGSYSNISGGTLGSSAAVYANLDLPDNSTITGLYFYYVDNNSTYGIGPAYIYEVQSSTGGTPSFNTNFPTTASTAAANTTTIALQSNLVDTPLVVDNDLKSYMVVISTIQNTSTLKIIRCRVRYQVPQAD